MSEISFNSASMSFLSNFKINSDEDTAEDVLNEISVFYNKNYSQCTYSNIELFSSDFAVKYKINDDENRSNLEQLMTDIAAFDENSDTISSDDIQKAIDELKSMQSSGVNQSPKSDISQNETPLVGAANPSETAVQGAKLQQDDDNTYYVEVEQWTSDNYKNENSSLYSIINNNYDLSELSEDKKNEARQKILNAIVEENNIKDPNLIYTGQKITLPDVEGYSLYNETTGQTKNSENDGQVDVSELSQQAQAFISDFDLYLGKNAVDKADYFKGEAVLDLINQVIVDEYGKDNPESALSDSDKITLLKYAIENGAVKYIDAYRTEGCDDYNNYINEIKENCNGNANLTELVDELHNEVINTTEVIINQEETYYNNLNKDNFNNSVSDVLSDVNTNIKTKINYLKKIAASEEYKESLNTYINSKDNVDTLLSLYEAASKGDNSAELIQKLNDVVSVETLAKSIQDNYSLGTETDKLSKLLTSINGNSDKLSTQYSDYGLTQTKADELKEKYYEYIQDEFGSNRANDKYSSLTKILKAVDKGEISDSEAKYLLSNISNGSLSNLLDTFRNGLWFDNDFEENYIGTFAKVISDNI